MRKKVPVQANFREVCLERQNLSRRPCGYSVELKYLSSTVTGWRAAADCQLVEVRESFGYVRHPSEKSGGYCFSTVEGDPPSWFRVTLVCAPIRLTHALKGLRVTLLRKRQT